MSSSLSWDYEASSVGKVVKPTVAKQLKKLNVKYHTLKNDDLQNYILLLTLGALSKTFCDDSLTETLDCACIEPITPGVEDIDLSGFKPD